MATSVPNNRAKRLLAAGIRTMLDKPVVPETIFDVIRYCARKTLMPTDHSIQAPPSQSELSALLSLERIGELRRCLSLDVLAGLVEACVSDMARRLLMLQKALKTGAQDEAAAEAHALLGMAGSYGLCALEAHLRVIASAARDGDLTRLGHDAITDLEHMFQASTACLRSSLTINIV